MFILVKTTDVNEWVFCVQDDEFREVVQNIETEKIAVEDISELYLIVYLIHSIVRARNMISAEGTVSRVFKVSY